MMPDFVKKKTDFYIAAIDSLEKSRYPFMVGGGFAVREYAPDIGRKMNDLDIFCKAGDYPKILHFLTNAGFKTCVVDERWLAKVTKDNYYVDLIFSSYNYIHPVDDSWLEHARGATVLGRSAQLIAPEEIIWCKSYIQDRGHYDGADINHIILNQGRTLDWTRLLFRMENHWDLLLSILLNFRFVYPSERDTIPNWLMQELVERLKNQLTNPIPQDKICRGPLLSRTQYQSDIDHKFQTFT